MTGLGVSVGVTNEKGEIRILEGRGMFASVFRADGNGTETLAYGESSGENLASVLIGLMRVYSMEAVTMAMMAALGSNDENTEVTDLEKGRGTNG